MNKNITNNLNKNYDNKHVSKSLKALTINKSYNLDILNNLNYQPSCDIQEANL